MDFSCCAVINISKIDMLVFFNVSEKLLEMRRHTEAALLLEQYAKVRVIESAL